VSCQDDLEDLFRGAIKSNTIRKGAKFLCEHGKGLHPRNARQGKLIPSGMYHALESIVQHEYEMFLDDQSLDKVLASKMTLMDHSFIEGENLTCQECGVSYQQETQEKYELFNVSWNVQFRITYILFISLNFIPRKFIPFVCQFRR
jgi:hypothetical protein